MNNAQMFSWVWVQYMILYVKTNNTFTPDLRVEQFTDWAPVAFIHLEFLPSVVCYEKLQVGRWQTVLSSHF